MSKDIECQLIEPEVLAELADKAMKEESRLGNPYLRALMIRFRGVALELKAALEREGHLERNSAHRDDPDPSHQ